VKKPVKLLLNGQPFTLASLARPQAKIIAFLEKSSKRNLYTSQEVLTQLEVCKSTLQEFLKNKSHDTYYLRYGKRLVFGHPAAIVQLRQQLKQEEASR
jgi:hypothetical protein